MIKENFIDNFLDISDVVGTMIQNILEQGGKVILFGTGYCLSMFIELMQSNNIEILAVCDNDQNKWNSSINGYKVLKPEEVLYLREKFCIVISTSHYAEIEKQLLNAGCKQSVYHLPMEAYYKNTVYGLNFVKENENNFRTVYDELADEISKEVFVKFISHNISLNNQYYKDIEEFQINGYFGTELFVNQEHEIIIDGGAYNGDTIQEFLSVPGRTLEEIIAYEPDNENCLELKKIKDKRVTIINKGLGKTKEMLRFCAGGGVSSNISEFGELVVEIDAIDNLVPERHITFIKMDIEGAEEEALIGAEKTIKRCKPILAISAYHRKKDLFLLVQLIKKFNPYYKIYFRHMFYYQTVKVQPDVIIYAIPQ